MFSPLINELIEALRTLPGVGPKSAQRMAFHLLGDTHRAKGVLLSKVLANAMAHIQCCECCQIYTETPICPLCSNMKRDQRTLCIVEHPTDVLAIEQSAFYNGLYFVLKGHLSPIDGLGPKEIGIDKLLARLSQSNIEEVIIATNATVEGEATAHYISTHIKAPMRCSRIAYGVPIGGELEYLDSNTLAHALGSRTLLNHGETK